MAYRTILVSLGIDPQAKPRLAAALDLAREHQARLIGCFANVWSDVFFHDRKTGSMEQARRALEEYARAARPEFEAACKAALVPGIFQRKAKPTTKTDDLIQASLAADLCVVSLSEKAGLDEGDIFLTLAEGAVTAAACPVLVLPDDPSPALGRSVLIAWKPRREAARALRDALPLLHKAKAITVLTVGAGSRDESVPAVRALLEAHQIHAEFDDDPAADAAAGEVILSRARLLGCDTLVMGAYGHSRLRELVLGGATRHVLENAKLSILMSH